DIKGSDQRIHDKWSDVHMYMSLLSFLSWEVFEPRFEKNSNNLIISYSRRVMDSFFYKRRWMLSKKNRMSAKYRWARRHMRTGRYILIQPVATRTASTIPAITPLRSLKCSHAKPNRWMT